MYVNLGMRLLQARCTACWWSIGFALHPLLPSRPSLHSLVAYWHPQLLIAAQVDPSDQGLGLKVTNAPEVGGCVIKEVADFCSATQELKPGDRFVFVPKFIFSYSI